MELNERHKAFVQVYMSNGFNATKAYMRTYPDASYDSARALSTNLLANDSIQNEIDRVRGEFEAKTIITKEEIIQKLYEIMMNNQGKKDTFTLKSIEILNKMLGYNEPEVIVNNGGLPPEISVNIIKPKGNE